MKIEPYDNMRFHVTGDTGRVYLVCLLSYRHIGRCECPHYTCRLEPEITRKLKEIGTQDRDRYRCKHIRHVRKAVAYKMLGLLLKEAEEGERRKHRQKDSA